MRHGPHHGAQKSTRRGNPLSRAAASNADVSGISTGTARAGRFVRQLPQRIVLPSVANRMRFDLPHDGQLTITPCRSAVTPMLFRDLAWLAAERPQQGERLPALASEREGSAA